MWAEMQKSFQKTQGECVQYKELYEQECTKRSQQEIRLQEDKIQRENDSRVLDVYKKETKALFDVACHAVSSEEGLAKVRRKYEELQEAVFSATHEDEKSQKGSKTPPTQPSGQASNISKQKSGAMMLFGGGNKSHHSRNVHRKYHEQYVKIVNVYLNGRLKTLPEDFCDPRKSFAKLYFSSNTEIDIERVLTSEQRKQLLKEQSEKIARQVSNVMSLFVLCLIFGNSPVLVVSSQRVRKTVLEMLRQRLCTRVRVRAILALLQERLEMQNPTKIRTAKAQRHCVENSMRH